MNFDPEKLISLFLNYNEAMSDADVAQLSEWIKADKANARQFVHAVHTHKSIHQILSKEDIQKQIEQADAQAGFCHNSHYEEDFWKELADAELNSPGLEPALKTAVRETVRLQKVERSVGKINRFSLWTAVSSVAALVFLLLYVVINPPPAQEVATLTDSMNVKWMTPASYDQGFRFQTHSEAVRLSSGIVKLMTDRDVELLVEGPAQFSFLSPSEIDLTYGKLFARVSEQGYGFSVVTANSRIIDLGTEFAVQADIRGDTELHVFTGKTNLFARGANEKPQLVQQGSARYVSMQDASIRDITLKENAFVQQIDSKQNVLWRGQRSVDLADIIGGGNGFGTGKLGYGIDPLSGRTAPFELPTAIARPGNETYTKAESNPLIDGIFVPDGGRGPIRIASTGVVFNGCPDTNGLFWSLVLNGGYIKDYAEAPNEPLRFDGKAYGDGTHAVIFIHSNLGVTFDLDAIRRELQVPEILEFRSSCGISDNNPNRVPYADFWVLVDGQIRFSKRGVAAGEPQEVVIPIQSTDRFLTLVTTDGGEEVSLKVDGMPFAIDSDWCMFAEPALMLKIAN